MPRARRLHQAPLGGVPAAPGPGSLRDPEGRRGGLWPCGPGAGRQHERLRGGPLGAQALAARRRAVPRGPGGLGGAKRRAPQRARLFNTLLADLYGPQKFLRNRILPAKLAMANPRFLRPCCGLGSQPGVFLHHYAVDIARSPDGKWWVLQDRMDAPSGLGYSLQNRFLVHTTLPQEFQGMQVQPISPFFHDFGASLARWPPPPAGARTPGSCSSRPARPTRPTSSTPTSPATLAILWSRAPT
jgi:hypothetical protein